jgi:aspartate aminotransferase-like enzyme
MIKKTRLFTPGPTPLLPAAMAAMAQSEVHHRTAEFRAAYKQVLEDLHYFYNTKNDVLMFTASGTGAMEAAVSNLFSPGDAVLVATAGKFGERWVEIARAFQLNVDTVEAPYGEPVSADAVRAQLSAKPYTGLLFQASETSTCVSHDVRAFAAAAREHGALSIVDAITGLGVMELDIDGWGLDVVIGGSQKSLAIPPGLAFSSVSATALERSKQAKLPRFYFSYAKEKKAADKGDASWTPSTALILALAESLKYVRGLGRENLIANAAFLAEAARAALRAMGLELFAKSSPSNAATSVCPPAGIDSRLVIRALRDRFGIIVANGQGNMEGKLFRLAHLGYYDYTELAGALAALELVLTGLGHPVQLGTGVRAAQEIAAKQIQQ